MASERRKSYYQLGLEHDVSTLEQCLLHFHQSVIDLYRLLKLFSNFVCVTIVLYLEISTSENEVNP